MTPSDGRFWLLSGNDLGVLLADYVLANHGGSRRPLAVRSIVSTPMMDLVATGHGALVAITLTGFKWIANAGLALEEEGEGRFVYGFEEALGYTVGGVVRDKDGLSAALLMADLVADLADRGETVLDRLAALWHQHGLWVSAQVSIPGDPESLLEAVERLGSDPPLTLGGREIEDFIDYREGAGRRPPWLGEQHLIELSLGASGRVLVRPSGTEPKLKIYADLCGDPGGDPIDRLEQLKEEAAGLGRALAAGLGL